MDYYKYIAIILVFRNTDDLDECIDSMYEKIRSIKIVVVNSYYDEKSRIAAKEVAEKRQCDFINIENKGYSYGNNRGIEYVDKYYKYSYVIISNPDIIVNKFEDIQDAYDVIAPKILTASGNQQNPMIVKRNRCAEFLIYQGLKHYNKMMFIAGVAINKIQRSITLFVNQKKEVFPIYQAHGSFVILSYNVIKNLWPLYDERIFLFAEESILSKRLQDSNFKTVYCKKITIYHKEDGSMKLSNIAINDELRRSNIYYYETYIKN